MPVTLSLPSSIPATLASVLFLDQQARPHLRAFALAISSPWNSSQPNCPTPSLTHSVSAQMPAARGSPPESPPLQLTTPRLYLALSSTWLVFLHFITPDSHRLDNTYLLPTVTRAGTLFSAVTQSWTSAWHLVNIEGICGAFHVGQQLFRELTCLTLL